MHALECKKISKKNFWKTIYVMLNQEYNLFYKNYDSTDLAQKKIDELSSQGIYDPLLAWLDWGYTDAVLQ